MPLPPTMPLRHSGPRRNGMRGAGSHSTHPRIKWAQGMARAKRSIAGSGSPSQIFHPATPMPLFNNANELDPDFASTYAHAAMCYVCAKTNGWTSDTANEIAEVTRLAKCAIELGTDDGI